MLQDEFLIHYPLTVRRLDFFKLAQTKGQLFTDFYAKLSGMGELADLAGIEIEDMTVFRIIVALHDDNLRQLILRLSELTLTEVMREARAYESASTTTQHMCDVYQARSDHVCRTRGPGCRSGSHVIKSVANEPNKVTHRFVYATLDSCRVRCNRA
jgi:hypothetical protein